MTRSRAKLLKPWNEAVKNRVRMLPTSRRRGIFERKYPVSIGIKRLRISTPIVAPIEKLDIKPLKQAISDTWLADHSQEFSFNNTKNLDELLLHSNEEIVFTEARSGIIESILMWFLMWLHIYKVIHDLCPI